MSDEERSASEHRSVLKGMTRDEAKALVAACAGLGDNGGSRDKLLALAALGARCVGAKERSEERFWCPDCGNGVSVSEDGGCGSCGRDVEIRACRVLVLEGE